MYNEEDRQKIESRAERAAELESLPSITIEQFEEAVRKWLLIEDPHILRILPYHYIANCLQGDPVWLMVNGASGGGKSELLYMFGDLERAVALSTLTPQTLVSGFPGKEDVSLLPKLNGKILVLKDFTTIISMQKDAQREIISQLREIYDGQYTKAFGNGKTMNWSGKVGLIAACTESFDMFAMYNASMGERFIQYRLVTGDRQKTADRAITNTADVVEMRKELRNAMYQLMKGIDLKQAVVPTPDEVRTRLIKLADFACLARSSVVRDMGMKRDVLFVMSPEMPTRLTQQLVRFVQAAMLARRGECTDKDMAAIYKIALDSIPKRERLIMQQLTIHNNQTTSEIAMKVGYPTSTTHIVLEDLSIKTLCLRIKGADSEEGGNADRWTLKQEYRDILAYYDKLQQEDEVPADIKALAESFGGEVLPTF